MSSTHSERSAVRSSRAIVVTLLIGCAVLGYTLAWRMSSRAGRDPSVTATQPIELPTSSELRFPDPLESLERRASPRLHEATQAGDSQEEPPKPFSEKLCRTELETLVTSCLEIDRDGRHSELGGLFQAFLDRWGNHAEWPELLSKQLWSASVDHPEKTRALALLARCWLGSALRLETYPPHAARAFVGELLARSASEEAEPAANLLRLVLCQGGEEAAPQLEGLASLGPDLLALLDRFPSEEDDTRRSAWLELLEDWGARAPEAAEWISALLTRGDSRIRLAAYRARLRSDPGAFVQLRESMRAEDAPVLREIAAWLVQRPAALGFADLRSLLDGIESTRLRGLRVPDLSRDLVFRGGLDAASTASAWRSLIGDDGAVARELRRGLIHGMSLIRPTREQVDLLVLASYDEDLRASALQTLGRVAPLDAAARLRELASSPALGDREDAVLACGNALDAGEPPVALLEALFALLDDGRLEIESRRRLASRLEHFAPERSAAWLSHRR